MLKLKNLLFEASITGQTQGSEEIGGYKGFFKLSEMEAYKKWLKKPLKVELVEGINEDYSRFSYQKKNITDRTKLKELKLPFMTPRKVYIISFDFI